MWLGVVVVIAFVFIVQMNTYESPDQEYIEELTSRIEDLESSLESVESCVSGLEGNVYVDVEAMIDTWGSVDNQDVNTEIEHQLATEVESCRQ